jgi:enamine deaminase RidA (YjgF/YER057c/UK114 family)
MPRKEIVDVKLAAPNPNLSPATRFGSLVFVAGQTGRHPTTGEVARDIREQTRTVLERIKVIREAAGTSLDNVLTVTTHLTKRASRSPSPRAFRTSRTLDRAAHHQFIGSEARRFFDSSLGIARTR